MSSTPIPDWWLKLRRAQAHLNALRVSVEGFVNSDAYGFEIGDPQSQSEKNVWMTGLLLKMTEHPPSDDWATIIGDIVHNLRSALDILVYQTAINPGDLTAFPIRIKEGDFPSGDSRILQGIPPKLRAIIEREQPYKIQEESPSSDPLAILADLDNAGKHRVIPTLISWFGVERIEFEGLDGVDEIHFSPAGLQKPEHGAMLGLITIRVRDGSRPKLSVKTSKAAHIVFDKSTDRAVGRPVNTTLAAIGNRIRGIIRDFESETAIKV